MEHKKCREAFDDWHLSKYGHKTESYACSLRWDAWKEAWYQRVPAGYSVMPDAITAENGAKAALMGEFFETEDIECPDCNDEDFCETCKCTGVIKNEVPVSWTTIKDIYKKAVECCQVR